MPEETSRHQQLPQGQDCTLSVIEDGVNVSKGDTEAMLFNVNLLPLTLGKRLHEYQSVAIGRFPPISNTLERLEVPDDQGFVSLSRHALTVTNGNGRLLLENRQNPKSGRVSITRNGVFVLVGPDGATVDPVPTDTVIKVEFFEGPRPELTVHVRASGGVTESAGVLTKKPAGAAVIEDWVLAINAVECARLAGEKPTAKAAMKYFSNPANFRAFKRAYSIAGSTLVGDPEAGHARLLEAAAPFIDPNLIQLMTESAGT